MRILIIEDDRDLCELMADSLHEQGYNIDCCHDGEEGYLHAISGAYELILLDRMLPAVDGLALLKKLRGAGDLTPVLMATALGSVQDVVAGLDGGADDYIVKPFRMEELLARVRARVRRPAPVYVPDKLVYHDVTLSPAEKTVQYHGKSTSLSKRECDLLELFFRNTDQTLPRATIFANVWGADSLVDDANIDNYIRFIRERLREIDAPLEIRTVRGVGYRLEEAKRVS